MIISPIYDANKDDLESFTCGSRELDIYLKRYALENDKNGYGKTFLLYDSNVLVGFFTLCSASIAFEQAPESLKKNSPRYPIPAIRLARLAVSEDQQGKGYGRELLKQAFLRILNIADTIGIRLIIVDAKESSTTFYEKYGFQRSDSDKLTYYLLLDTLKKAIN